MNRHKCVDAKGQNVENTMWREKNSMEGGYQNRVVVSFGNSAESISICRGMVGLRRGTSVCTREGKISKIVKVKGEKRDQEYGLK